MANRASQDAQLPKRSDGRTMGERVEESIRILLEHFGFSLLDKLSSNVNDLGMFFFGKHTGHPLGVAWKHLLDTKYLLLLGHKPQISKELCVCFALTDYLDSICMSENLERLISDLSNENDQRRFYKAFFEAHIASGLRSCGLAVAFVRESTERTPDLRLHLREREIVAECKSLDPKKIEMSAVWRSIIERTVNYADKREMGYEIHITPAPYFKPSDSKKVLEFLRELIDRETEGIFHEPDGLVRVLMKKLVKDYYGYIENLEIEFDDDESSYLQVKTEDIEKGFCAPIYVGVLEKYSKPILPAIENNLKKARKKFDNYRDCICVVYLEITANSARELSQKMDICDFFIRQKLKNTKSISAVVISAYLYRGDTTWPFQQYSSIVINDDARNPLEGTLIYGMEPLLEGAIDTDRFSCCQYFDSSAWLDHLDKIHVLFAIRDSVPSTQVKLLLVDNTYFKFEYENSKTGKTVLRNMCKFPLENGEPDIIGFAASVNCTSKREIFYVNGKPSELKYCSNDYSASFLKYAEKSTLFLDEARLLVEDLHRMAYQCQPFLISSDYNYQKYYSDIDRVKQELKITYESWPGKTGQVLRW